MTDIIDFRGVDRRALAKQRQAKMTARIAEMMTITLLRITADKLNELADEWESKAFFESQRAEFDSALTTLCWAECELNEKLAAGA